MAERVLIVRFSAIGDIVMALPIAATIRASDPESSVAWFVDRRFRELLSGHRHIASVFAFDRERYRGKGTNPMLWTQQLRSYLAVRQFRPTIAIDLQGHSKTALAARFSGAKRRFVLDPKDPIATATGQPIYSDDKLHMVERNLKAAAVAGFERAHYEFSIPVRQEERDWVQVRLGSAPYMTVHLGGTHPKKVWPVEGFVKAIEMINPIRLVLVGGPDETTLAHRFLLHTRSESLVGETKLLQLSEVLRRSKLHLSGDTGTAHIAAALGARCITVFGHMPPAVYHPWGQPEAVVASGDDALSVTPEMVYAKYRQIGVAA